MARFKIPITVLGSDGRPFAGASVTVRKRSDLTNATVYSAETGGGTIANPLTTDASGRVAGWVDRGAYECVVTGSGLTTFIEPLDAAPAGDSGIDSGWIAPDAVTNPKVDDTGMPIGIVLPFAGATSPSSDWLLCDGVAYSRATYSELFARIGVLFGAGDGTTTFNVPDLRGRFPIGKGTHVDVDTLGKSDGVALASRKPKHQHGRGTLAVDAVGNHHHDTPETGNVLKDHTSSGPHWAYADSSGSADIRMASSSTTDAGAHSHSTSGAIGDTTSALTDTVPYLVLNHLIRAR